MKRILLLIMMFLLVTGCGKKEENIIEKKLTAMGNDYYSKYMKGSNLDIAIISLKDFREANEMIGESYDLSEFKDCNEDTLVKIYLKSGTTQIEKYEFEINCKN